MVGLPFLDSASGPATVSHPVAKLSFAGGGGGGSGLGGLASAAADLLGAATGADPWRDHLTALRLRRALAPQVDVLELCVARASTAPSVSLDDEGSLSLNGSDGSDVPVFKGKVDGIREQAHGTRLVTVTNGGRQLSQARLNRSFEQQDAGQIIQALASELGLSCDLSGSGTSLPRFVVDDRAGLYAHIARLAALSGLLVRVDADGRLAVLDPASPGEPVARLAYGVDVLNFSLGGRAPHTAAVQITGEGAAGSDGSDAWCWLRKDPAANQASAGSGTPLRSLSVAALRSADAVATVARAKVARASEGATRGWLTVAGTPQVAPGDNVAISSLPEASLDGTYRVDEVVHAFDARRGFRSRLGVVSAGAASSGALDLIGGLL